MNQRYDTNYSLTRHWFHNLMLVRRNCEFPLLRLLAVIVVIAVVFVS